MKHELEKKKLIIKFAKKLNSTNLSPLRSGNIFRFYPWQVGTGAAGQCRCGRARSARASAGRRRSATGCGCASRRHRRPS